MKLKASFEELEGQIEASNKENKLLKCMSLFRICRLSVVYSHDAIS